MDAPWIGQLEKHAGNPILRREPSNGWEAGATYNSSAVVWDKRVWMIYRAEDVPPKLISEENLYTGRLGLASSDDGFRFDRVSNQPIIGTDGRFAADKTRGVEDPRLTQMDDGRFLLTYTAFSGKTLNDWGPGRIKLFLAESRDLRSWHEYGPVFPFSTKSGGILGKKVGGRYVMYYGDTDIFLAESEDGVRWQSTRKLVFGARAGYADDGGVEVGPSPILTRKGILLIYNMIRKDKPMHYLPGYVLLDKDDPTRVLDRSEEPILRGELEMERCYRCSEFHGGGNYILFAMGSVIKDGRFFLYYGCADEVVGVASAPVNPAWFD